MLFRQATIIDGSEDATPYVADLLVSDGLIERIAPHIEIPGSCQIIEAKGLVLCPGFIDMHAHSDLHLLTDPSHTPKVSQGCTVSRSPHSFYKG
jgi:N-acyl-D-amino-acid deacylase